MTVEERFWSRVDASGDCWEWLGYRSETGYGRFSISHSEQDMAHRFAWRLLVGAIEPGLHIDHLCRNHGCVNPDHVQVVSVRVNVLRGYGPTAVRARQTHCIHGHEFTPDNTRIKRTGYRLCRTCHREGVKRRKRERRAAA